MLLESMVLGENIARNAALRENVFMMAVCVDLRIPLFLVGKPGSSKSLAKAIVADSMRGQASQNELLKSFKQVSLLKSLCQHLIVFLTPDSHSSRFTCSPTSVVSCPLLRVSLRSSTQPKGSRRMRTPQSMCQWWCWMRWGWLRTPPTSL